MTPSGFQVKLGTVVVVLADLAHYLEITISAIYVLEFLIQSSHTLIEPVDITDNSRQNVQLHLLIWILHSAELTYLCV